jgi:hypothetical protein
LARPRSDGIRPTTWTARMGLLSSKTSICYLEVRMPDSDAELTAEEKQYPLDPSLLDVDGSVLTSRHRDRTISAWHSATGRASSTDPATAVGGASSVRDTAFAHNLDLTPRSFEMLGAMPLKGTLT